MTSKSATAVQDLDDLFAAIDANDAAAFVGFLTDDAVFRFGSAPAIEGRDAIRQGVQEFFDTIAGCSHRLINTVSSGSTLFCEGETTYTRHDGSKITVPFADVFEYEGDLIAQYKIYADITALYET